MIFKGSATSVEENAIRDARIAARAQNAALQRGPLLATMRQSALTGAPEQETAPATAPEDGFWVAGMRTGSAPIDPS